MNKLVYEATINGEDISTEDSGQAKIATITEDNDGGDGTGDGVFFRFQSWCEGGVWHPVFDSLMKPGKRVRVTLEVLN